MKGMILMKSLKKKIICPNCDGEGCSECNKEGKVEAEIVKQ